MGYSDMKEAGVGYSKQTGLVVGIVKASNCILDM